MVGTGMVDHDHSPGLPEFVDECVVGTGMVEHDHGAMLDVVQPPLYRNKLKKKSVN